ncbi:hypothetical protein [Photobacterium atrarenae]|nr:hypothetical protein [Photobacterium atrarenae]
MSAKTQGLRKRVRAEAQAHLKGVREKFLQSYVEKVEKEKVG